MPKTGDDRREWCRKRAQDINCAAVGKAIGVPEGSIRAFRNGGALGPEKLDRLCDYFNKNPLAGASADCAAAGIMGAEGGGPSMQKLENELLKLGIMVRDNFSNINDRLSALESRIAEIERPFQGGRKAEH